MRPSETRMYDLLQCTQEWTIPYSQIYVDGELCCTDNSNVKDDYMSTPTVKVKCWWFEIAGRPCPVLHSFSILMDVDRTESGDMWHHNDVNQNIPTQRLSLSLRWSLYLNCQRFSLHVTGASIDINCETNGDIDAMDCSWKNTQWTKPKFKSR